MKSLLVLGSIFLFALAVNGQPSPDLANRPANNARVFHNIQYVPFGNEFQKLDLFLPGRTNQLLPLIIWVHGGAWSRGSKENCPVLRFVARGYAVASINYRLSQHATFPAQIEDCKAAVRWLRAHAGVCHLDPNRFGAIGASAGGHLVALLGTAGDVKEFEVGSNLEVSSRVQAVVDCYGPINLSRMGAQAGPNSRLNHDAPDAPEAQLIGGPLPENKEKVKRANPESYISKEDPPFLIVQGDADPIVPCQQSEEFYAALKQAGVEATLHIVKGGGHDVAFGFGADRLVEEFFTRHLGK